MEKNKETGAIWRIDALRRVLKEVHSLFVMFHGSIRALIEKELTGGLTRSQLYPFITDYLSSKRFLSNLVQKIFHSTENFPLFFFRSISQLQYILCN